MGTSNLYFCKPEYLCSLCSLGQWPQPAACISVLLLEERYTGMKEQAFFRQKRAVGVTSPERAVCKGLMELTYAQNFFFRFPVHFFHSSVYSQHLLNVEIKLSWLRHKEVLSCDAESCWVGRDGSLGYELATRERHQEKFFVLFCVFTVESDGRGAGALCLEAI